MPHILPSVLPIYDWDISDDELEKTTVWVAPPRTDETFPDEKRQKMLPGVAFANALVASNLELRRLLAVALTGTRNCLEMSVEDIQARVEAFENKEVEVRLQKGGAADWKIKVAARGLERAVPFTLDVDLETTYVVRKPLMKACSARPGVAKLVIAIYLLHELAHLARYVGGWAKEGTPAALGEGDDAIDLVSPRPLPGDGVSSEMGDWLEVEMMGGFLRVDEGYLLLDVYILRKRHVLALSPEEVVNLGNDDMGVAREGFKTVKRRAEQFRASRPQILAAKNAANRQSRSAKRKRHLSDEAQD